VGWLLRKLFRQLTGWEDAWTDRERIQFSTTSAVGVVIEGKPGICYEPGFFLVEPRYSDGRQYHGSDWSTCRIPVEWTDVRWSGPVNDRWGSANAIVQVTDPPRLWRHTSDVDAPIESVLGNCLRDAVAAGTDPSELDAAALSERATSYGLALEEVFVEVARHETYELETKSRGTVTVEILIEEAGPRSLDRLAVFREMIAEALEPGDTIAELDAETINERASTEQGVRVFDVEPLSEETMDESAHETQRTRV
jgi:hypothetical protein